VACGRRQGKKSTFQTINRTAEQPGQTLNIDLCFVPAKHLAESKLPAVSGSSGHLVVERPKDSDLNYPGRIFENPTLTYEEAMRAFVEASKQPKVSETVASASEYCSQKAAIRQVRQEESQLRAERRGIRIHRQQEDAAWQSLRQEHRQEEAQKSTQRARHGKRAARQKQWKALRQQRQQTLSQRHQEDAAWRQQREELRQRMTLLPIITAWMAILVITDNCTRQCMGLPLFVAGSSVTAEMVVAALQALLPDELQFLISDRGVHFTAHIFEQLADQEDFLHVVIARHRPQSNGIAERFVRTLKEWLADKTWSTEQELQQLLAQFLAEYNDRPHQGLAIPGLSPNEFAGRIWLM
jgi:transposase InsO family protein